MAKKNNEKPMVSNLKESVVWQYNEMKMKAAISGVINQREQREAKRQTIERKSLYRRNDRRRYQ